MWGGGTSSVGRYHLPVLRSPFFMKILHPMTPFLTTVHMHPMTPFFWNFNVKFQILHALCANFETFVNLQLKLANFHSNLTKFTLNNPYFRKFTPKKAFFFYLTPNDPFLQNPTLNAPCFRSLVGTYPSLSYSSAPHNLGLCHRIYFVLWICKHGKPMTL